MVLALKQWVEINPALEFRCFCRHRRLLAISQASHCLAVRP